VHLSEYLVSPIRLPVLLLSMVLVASTSPVTRSILPETVQVLRHELAHCNGWKHPPTTEGRKFNIGDKWDEAEGGKWIAAITKMPKPKLPVLTRILPASPSGHLRDPRLATGVL